MRRNRIIRLLIRLLRIYTPFICVLSALLNGVFFFDETAPEIVYMFATLTGNSILVDLFMFSVSFRMCIWYKICVVTIMLMQIAGLLYNSFGLTEVIYYWAVMCFSITGVISFVVFFVLYVVFKKVRRIGKRLA